MLASCALGLLSACGDAGASGARQRVETAATAAAPPSPASSAAVGAASTAHASTPDASTDPASGAAPLVDGALQAEVDALVRAFTPPPRDVTSDVTDAWIRARKAALLANQSKRPLFAEACWNAYRTREELPFDVRRDLLEVAAHSNPEALTERLATEFDAYGVEIGLRSRALALLAEVDPRRTLALLEPLLLEVHKTKTYPPQETLLGAWNAAAVRLGTDRAPLLGRIAADLLQDDAARHLAVRQLGTCDGDAAAQALEAVLVESTGNGYLRRLAAQSLADNKAFHGACATLRRVLGRESDENFARFLDDLVAKSCR